MAYQGYEVDDSYADDEQHFIKVYFDFDTEDECLRFAELAGGVEFGRFIEEFGKRACGERGE